MSTATQNYVTREEIDQLVRHIAQQAVAEELESVLGEFGTQMKIVSDQMLSLVQEMRQIVQQSLSHLERVEQTMSGE
jgi:hypothetical protein